MKAIIKNYRRGRKTQHANQAILLAEGTTSKEEAAKLLGKKVTWKTKTGKIIAGKVSRVHGKKGAVIARFTKGIPGQAIGTKATIY